MIHQIITIVLHIISLPVFGASVLLGLYTLLVALITMFTMMEDHHSLRDRAIYLVLGILVTGWGAWVTTFTFNAAHWLLTY